MKNSYKVIGGSLVGGVGIHVALVACSAATDGGVAGDGGIIDAMKDAIAAVLDAETKDAKAENDAAAGACSCSVPNPIKSVTADTDSNQLMRGGLQAGATATKVVDGPFVLTDADVGQGQLGNGWGGESELTLEASAAACAGTGTMFAQVGQNMQTAQYGTTIHGGRYLVPAGKMLCAKGNVLWAGFKPYQ